MTKENEKRNRSETIQKDDLWEKIDRDEQELLAEEINKKLFAELSHTLEERSEDTEPEKENTSQKNISQKNVSKQKTHKGEDLKEKISQKNASKKKTARKKVSKKKHRSRKYFKVALTILLAVILWIIALAACIVGIYCKGKNHMTSTAGITFQIPEGINASSANNGKTITYENKNYQRRAGTTNILMIGKNPDHTFSTVVVNFDRNSKSLRYMPVPASLIAIDYSSAMDYSDIADYVSEFLCGIPIQGYMVLDMEVVDVLMETNTKQAADNIQMQKLAVFTGEVADNASDNWMIPAKIFEEFQESFSTNLRVADLSYVYTLFVVCETSSECELTEPTDQTMVFQQFLDTFYDEKQE